MIRTNKDYAHRVKERLMKKNPEVFSGLSEIKIRVVLNYFTKNMAVTVFKHRHASVTNFLNIYPNPSQLFEYRVSFLKRVPMASLWKYFKLLQKNYKDKKSID